MISQAVYTESHLYELALRDDVQLAEESSIAIMGTTRTKETTAKYKEKSYG